MKTVSLFSGIGGIEVGLEKHKFETLLFCEIDPIARAVLAHHFPHADIAENILTLRNLPDCDLVTAGFPCQDLSQAGAKRGIDGAKSGLVKRLLELLQQKRRARKRAPNWLLIENVPYMLSLDSGSAMAFLTTQLSELGYRWAYRVVDARAFGLPQRRPRVVLLAAREGDPRTVIHADDFPEPDLDGKPGLVDKNAWYGFYWTEGSRGVGWVKEGVPPIKCGSTLGIASPPAVWKPREHFVGMIDIVDAERLQGFGPNWTNFERIGVDARPGLRWRLIGNAVSTKLSEWVGARMCSPGVPVGQGTRIDFARRWPDAGYGDKASGAFGVKLSRWPSNAVQKSLSTFLTAPMKPLSARATNGFLNRALTCTNVSYAPHFLESLQRHKNVQASVG
jgi:DNA (cytosine-5)-methyltransferase 1